jgi:CRP/FNR family transcriptional regulator, cyclic AMP receptor protein
MEGALTCDLQPAERPCTRLVTAGELMLLGGWKGESIPLLWGWTVLEPTQLALFDERTLLIARQCPHLMLAILKRAAERPRHALLQQAISQLPRIEDRLLALFWSIADRRGIVRPDGICVHLQVTQETLARMTGARRPTISLSLRTLADRGLVVARDGQWIINPDSIELLRPR